MTMPNRQSIRLPRPSESAPSVSSGPRARTASDDWDARKEVSRLRKAGQLTAALALAEAALDRSPHFEPLKSALGWCLHDRDIKPLADTPDLTALRRAWKTCARIRELAASDPYGPYEPWVKSVLKTAKAMIAHQGSDTRTRHAAIELLNGIDAEQLSWAGYKGGRSDAETLLLVRSKALHDLEVWGPLRGLCESALTCTRLPPESELWIRHRLCTALLALDDAESAAPHAAFVLARKPGEWWASRNDARARARTGDGEGAMRAFAAALQGGQYHMKWRLLVELADLLIVNGDEENARLHRLLARESRRKQGWPPVPELESHLAAAEAIAPDDVARCRALWDRLTEAPRFSGTVCTVFEHGSGGFVECDDGRRIFFGLPRGRSAPSVGTRVSFCVEPAYDPKKRRASERAVRIWVADAP